MQTRNRAKLRQKSINEQPQSKQYFYDDLKKEYTVGQLKDVLKKKWGIDFHGTEWRALKTRAVAENSYLLDIACDVKELLTMEEQDKYFYIDVLLSVFKKELELQK